MSTPAEEAYEGIQRFLASAGRPVVIEAGHEPIALDAGTYLLEPASKHVFLQAWDRDRNLVRKVTAIDHEKPGKLTLAIEKFGSRAGTIDLVDLDKPRSEGVTRRAARSIYAEQFRRSLLRQFPGWRIASFSTEPDLEHSLSPSYPRASIRKGNAGWAVIGAGPNSLAVDGVLAFGLIWLDYLRRHATRVVFEGLAIFLPEGRHQTTCLRLRHLHPAVARWEVYAYGSDFEDRVELADAGNLHTVLPVRRGTTQPNIPDRLLALKALPGVQEMELADGGRSFRVNGLEIAHTVEGEVYYGIDSKRKLRGSDVAEIEALTRGVRRMRAADAPDRHGGVYSRQPELWLESEVRQHLNAIDARLQPEPIYGQVPSFAGGERGVIDLLAVEYQGRLAVVELKASEDLHLPLQALDYWMRVRWHAERGEWNERGYFPGQEISRKSPSLYLVAPALAFHPTTETILRYFPSDLDVVRVGLGMDWRTKLQVMFRAEGAASMTD